jgi:ornithine carbamoyltransferase
MSEQTNTSGPSIDHLITLSEVSPSAFQQLLSTTDSLKEQQEETDVLQNRSLALLFEKPSTRTRVSFEVGITELGGTPVTLNANEIQLSRGEPVRDTARVLSRYADAIIARVYDHGSLEECTKFGSVPVINALSDFAHPCQAIADVFTIQEKKGDLDRVSASFVGDGNNVCHSLMMGAALSGLSLTVATPSGYEPEDRVESSARKIGAQQSAELTVLNDPKEAVQDADVVYTDVWTSMGQEEEADQRKRNFEGFQVNDELLDLAQDDAIVMHCLPAHREEEITDSVLESPQSVVWQQAENRLHTQKALLTHMFQHRE